MVSYYCIQSLKLKLKMFIIKDVISLMFKLRPTLNLTSDIFSEDIFGLGMVWPSFCVITTSPSDWNSHQAWWLVVDLTHLMELKHVPEVKEFFRNQIWSQYDLTKLLCSGIQSLRPELKVITIKYMFLLWPNLILVNSEFGLSSRSLKIFLRTYSDSAWQARAFMFWCPVFQTRTESYYH